MVFRARLRRALRGTVYPSVDGDVRRGRAMFAQMHDVRMQRASCGTAVEAKGGVSDGVDYVVEIIAGSLDLSAH